MCQWHSSHSPQLHFGTSTNQLMPGEREKKMISTLHLTSIMMFDDAYHHAAHGTNNWISSTPTCFPVSIQVNQLIKLASPTLITNINYNNCKLISIYCCSFFYLFLFFFILTQSFNIKFSLTVCVCMCLCVCVCAIFVSERHIRMILLTNLIYKRLNVLAIHCFLQ